MPKMPKLPRLGNLFKGSQFGGNKLNQTQLLVLAGAFCFLLACVTFFLLPSGEQNNQQKAVPMTQVVVAKQDIPQRTVITESMLKVVDMPQDAVPSGAIVDMSDAIDKPANVPIQEGDILTDKKVVTDPRLAGFAGSIPPDCRAISVGITDITGIAGFAKPGDYVDVMIIRNDKDKHNVSGEILLQNVLLLGINKTAESGDAQPADKKDNKDKKNDKAKSVDANASKDAMATATLALTSEEALKLAVEAQTGTVYLVLRPVVPDDIYQVDTEYSRQNGEPAPAATQSQPAPAASAPASSPAPSYTPPAVQPAPASAPAAPSVRAPDDSIEVIRGVTSTNEGGN